MPQSVNQAILQSSVLRVSCQGPVQKRVRVQVAAGAGGDTHPNQRRDRPAQDLDTRDV